MIRPANFMTPFGGRVTLQFERETKGSRSRRHYVWRTAGLQGYITPQPIVTLQPQLNPPQDPRKVHGVLFLDPRTCKAPRAELASVQNILGVAGHAMLFGEPLLMYLDPEGAGAAGLMLENAILEEDRAYLRPCGLVNNLSWPAAFELAGNWHEVSGALHDPPFNFDWDCKGSFKENGVEPGLQVTVWTNGLYQVILELDIDLHLDFFGHAEEVLRNVVTGSLTNPIVVAQMLAIKRGIYPSYTIAPNPHRSDV